MLFLCLLLKLSLQGLFSEARSLFFGCHRCCFPVGFLGAPGIPRMETGLILFFKAILGGQLFRLNREMSLWKYLIKIPLKYLVNI